ncbi:MAG: FAD-binding protein [Deltaproteobacteria bacterium]|nr:FAD-binding protein [Deltaproteobacteria bacterium]MBW2123208.1 FAD-binding protein [Deltaproteobacteria bacterium]
MLRFGIMETVETDVLVIGAGAAGIRAALAASERGSKVVVVAKGGLTHCGSTFSPLSEGWGFQALIGAERTEANLEAFFDDIVRVGLGRCNEGLARLLVEESGPRFEDLVAHGLEFRKDSQGRYLRVRGCFSDHERAFVTDPSRSMKGVFGRILERSRALLITGCAAELIVEDGNCWGAWILTQGEELLRMRARATILATGGGAGIFRDNLVSDGQIGDGYALAHRAGAELRNLEFVQFMLGLTENGGRRFLPLSDLDRAGVLTDYEGNDLLELTMPNPRARAEAVRQRQKHAPFSSRDESYLIDVAVARSLKGRKEIFWRGDPGRRGQEMCRVRHFAHAFNGGIEIDERAESTIPGLFAAGEVAAGPHGADRIGGCMMTATQVFGERAGREAARRAMSLKDVSFPDSVAGGDIEWAKRTAGMGTAKPPRAIGSGIREAVNRYSMVLRSKKGLERCGEILHDSQQELTRMRRAGQISPGRFFEMRNMILTAMLVTEAALDRDRSLGPHFREDTAMIREKERAGL